MRESQKGEEGRGGLEERATWGKRLAYGKSNFWGKLIICLYVGLENLIGTGGVENGKV